MSVSSSFLTIAVGHAVASLAFENIASAQHLCDEHIDQIGRIDDVLELRLRDGTRLRIPQSSVGFATALSAMGKAVPIQHRWRN